MKLAGFYKHQNKNVILKTDYSNLQDFEKVYISKVFTQTKISDEERILSMPNVEFGGTGFFYDKAEPLSYDVEHSRPDYSLYSDYVSGQINKGVKPSTLRCFTDYSIGFLTRGCFRKCDFCVNKRYDRCVTHSPLFEFYDDTRKKIMLLDDNILAGPKWRCLFEQLDDTGKPYTFKQGIDIRLITPEFCKDDRQIKIRWRYILRVRSYPRRRAYRTQTIHVPSVFQQTGQDVCILRV